MEFMAKALGFLTLSLCVIGITHTHTSSIDRMAAKGSCRGKSGVL